MDWGTIAQIVLTAAVATGTTLFVNARQERERVACFVDWRYVEDDHGVHEYPYLGVHNRSPQPIAVHSVRYWLTGLLVYKPQEGTALEYEDPLELAFPYLVPSGEIRTLPLDAEQAGRLAEGVGGLKLSLFKALGTHRILVEVLTTARTRILVPAEGALPWSDQLPRSRY